MRKPSTRTAEIAARRNNVIRYLVDGYSQSEIADKMKVHPRAISRDVEHFQLTADIEVLVETKSTPKHFNTLYTAMDPTLRKVILNEQIDAIR